MKILGQRQQERARVAEVVTKAAQAETGAEVAMEVLAPKVRYRKSTRRGREISQYLGFRSARWSPARTETLHKEREAQKGEGKDTYGPQLDGPG